MLFLQESEGVLHGLHVTLELDRVYQAQDIGHFRAFCWMKLKEPKHGIWFILFGSYDRPGQGEEIRSSKEWAGIKHGLGGCQWEKHLTVRSDGENEDGDVSEYIQVGSSSSSGMDSVQLLTLQYSHDNPLVRYQPRLSLRDLDDAWLVPLLNESLATKIKAIHIYANGYKLLELDKSQFRIDRDHSDADVPPLTFDPDELSDPWIRIRPSMATFVELSFVDRTPKRLFESVRTMDSLKSTYQPKSKVRRGRLLVPALTSAKQGPKSFPKSAPKPGSGSPPKAVVRRRKRR